MAIPFLEIETPIGRKRLKLTGKPVTIGRHPDNFLMIEDDRASRFHCVLEKTPDGYLLRDLDSRNGTKVNESRTHSQILQSGDLFRIGKTRFRFVDPDNEPIPVGMDGEAEGTRPTEHATAPPAPDFSLDSQGPRPTRPNRPTSSSVLETNVEPDYNALLADLGSTHAYADHEKILRQMAESGFNKDFEDTDIALVNARGTTVHASSESGLERRKRKSRSHGDDSDSAEGIRVLRLLLLVCFRSRATDLHIEPKTDDFQIRLRVDGTMVDVVRIQKSVALRLLGVVKVLAEIDISQRNIIQEGHFSSNVPGRRVDYRVSFTPSMFGQKLVLRILDLANAPRFMSELHLPSWMYDTIRRVSRQDAGMVLVCGPTGSGKTTTLYSVLRDIDAAQRNVITIEDPVEYQIEGCTQIPINEEQGNSFTTLLRSVLRQDPDVILLGEIRDKQTAQTAMQAAMTGHLVLSTVHSKDTIGSIFRLLDLGIEPYLVAASLNLVLAQRLVRMLCPNCKIDKKPTSQQTLAMGKYVEGVTKIFFPVGCKKCLRTGYINRRAIFETLIVTDDMRDVILKTPTIQAIRRAIQMTMFQSLRQSGYNYVLDGITSIDEVERVVGTD